MTWLLETNPSWLNVYILSPTWQIATLPETAPDLKAIRNFVVIRISSTISIRHDRKHFINFETILFVCRKWLGESGSNKGEHTRPMPGKYLPISQDRLPSLSLKNISHVETCSSILKFRLIRSRWNGQVFRIWRVLGSNPDHTDFCECCCIYLNQDMITKVVRERISMLLLEWWFSSVPRREGQDGTFKMGTSPNPEMLKPLVMIKGNDLHDWKYYVFLGVQCWVNSS